MKAALYVRCSTHIQEVGRQIEDLRSYCMRREIEVFKEYRDEGVSGAKESRPALNDLLSDARSRLFDCVIVTEFSRFARSMKQLITALDEFKALKIHFISLSEHIDTTLPAGELIFGVFAALAQFERRMIQSRVKSGLRNAVRRGKRLGRPPQIDPQQVKLLRARNLSLGQIAKMIGVTKSAVSKSLSRQGLNKRLKNSGSIEDEEGAKQVE